MQNFTPTPNNVIRSALRQLWMRSKERNQAIKNANRQCVVCSARQSAAKGREVKLNAHHTDGIDWADLIRLVRERLLMTPDAYTVVCERCHKQEHDEEKVRSSPQLSFNFPPRDAADLE